MHPEGLALLLVSSFAPASPFPPHCKDQDVCQSHEPSPKCVQPAVPDVILRVVSNTSIAAQGIHAVAHL